MARRGFARHARGGRYQRTGAARRRRGSGTLDGSRTCRGGRTLPDIAQPYLDLPVPERKRPPRAAYALPTLFTAGNIFLGYLCILRTIQGALTYSSNPSQAAQDFEVAAKTIGFAFILD